MEKSIAWIDDVKMLAVYIGETEVLGEEKPVVFWQNNRLEGKIEKLASDDYAVLVFEEEIPLGYEMELQWGEHRFSVHPRGIVRTPWFDERYDATDEKLGAVYTETATTFSVWSPTAIRMTLHVNDNPYEMERKDNGVWERTLEGNWKNARYYYEVTTNGKNLTTNDPYAKSMTANSGFGIVLDSASTDPSHFRDYEKPAIDHAKDAIIYELHVRDATIFPDSGVENKGKFLGLSEKDTRTSSGHSTGLSYIKDLGCTHVQLLPVNDFARVDESKPDGGYNWGYDPLYYQVPEGSYALDATDPESRVREAKQMIKAFHEEDLSVILDVVYNHVFIQEESPFEKLVPGYYFRYHQVDILSNGTGTGNDIASERRMVRKFILDTIDYWLSEFRVDGFRFDLMGIMDVKTMLAIKERCERESAPVLLLGEGWELDTPLPPEQKATIFQSHQLKGISFFNDKFRDSIKGNLFEQTDVGFANGDGRYIELLPQLISGSCLPDHGEQSVTEPFQSVNYVECHDNHTLWDKLELSNEEQTREVRKSIHQIATGLTLLSQGIPFLHAGQEWFRTKQGDENSYISGDEINQLDWSQRVREAENIEWVKALIALRKKYHMFRLATVDEIKERLHILKTPDPVFGFTLFGDDEDLAIFVNPLQKSFQIHLPSPGRWEKLLSNHTGGMSPLCCIVGEQMHIEPYELTILKKPRV
ncbi:type I pullulanase [Sediminibacillus massiliensis]|uniref:type I pullulanase n=1 Tax=Sediminibacillus massiliensis TaxID=1926277 RepID=UPI0009887206|nr:type I pullulanase [Sediminibacillus massiliensis]